MRSPKTYMFRGFVMVNNLNFRWPKPLCLSRQLQKFIHSQRPESRVDKESSHGSLELARRTRKNLRWLLHQPATAARQGLVCNNNNNNNNKQQTTNNKQQTTNNKQQTTNNKQQTTNNKQQTTNNKQQTTNNKQQTTNNKQQTTNNKQQTTTTTTTTNNNNNNNLHPTWSNLRLQTHGLWRSTPSFGGGVWSAKNPFVSLQKFKHPGYSKWPFHPLFSEATFSPSQKGHKELPEWHILGGVANFKRTTLPNTNKSP